MNDLLTASPISQNLMCFHHTQIDLPFQLAAIRKFVRNLGIPTNLIGYEYIVESLRYMINSKEIMFLNEVYKHISELHRTSVQAVEVSIRNALRKAMKVNSECILQTLKLSNYIVLSNSVFLNTMKEIILEKILIS